MTRCQNAHHNMRNGLMSLVALVKLYVPFEHEHFFMKQIERIESALNECNCEKKDEEITD